MANSRPIKKASGILVVESFRRDLPPTAGTNAEQNRVNSEDE